MRKIAWMMTLIVTMNAVLVSTAQADSREESLQIKSDSAIVMEASTGKVLYEKHAKEPMYPASLTKIATAIYAIENGKLDDIVTVSGNARKVDGTTVFLEKGEKVRLKKLIQGLLINSGNDAGIAIAEHLSGDVKSFAKDLNIYLKEVIGTEQTNFENPHGLFDENHVTTAEDLAKITQYAMKNDVFMDIFSTKEMDWHGKTWDTTIQTHHKLVKEEIPYKGVTGGKNGFVSQSGYTLATTAERDDLKLITVTLKSNVVEDAYNDTIKLLDYGFENFTTSSIPKGTTFTFEDQQYATPEKIVYTHAQNDKLVEKVEVNGVLKMMNQDGEAVDTFQLDEIKKDKPAVAARSSENQPSAASIVMERFFSSTYLSIVFFIGVITIFYFQVRKLRITRRNRDKFYF
ncbi:D-alanyl-D-alanine carboxypeptidase family protein [Oceanobacillus sp. FSL K6-2867]|uniref:D-alanyl-D-alanine carboxypeptidase family protein n=1 Tax=Oceanobacillus sp. FSL K6-2867 TaxID=2954748 RepID=UPI0030DC41DC